MTYTQTGERVTLEMTRDDYAQLTLMLGFAVGAASAQGRKDNFWRWLRFVNELNRTNPNFKPYAIPPEFLKENADAKEENANA